MYLQYKNFGYGYRERCNHHEGKHNYEEHIHQFSEVVCVLKGSVEITVNGVTQTANEGDLAVILPFHSHSYRTQEYCKLWVGVISSDWVEEFIPHDELRINNNAVFTPSRTVFSYAVENAPPPRGMRDSSTMSKTEFRNTKALYTIIINEYLSKIEPAKGGNVSSHPLAALYLYVYNHFKEPLTLKQVASAIGYTSTYISHCLSAIPNNNFRNVVNSARTEYSKKLLVTTNKKIIDIAFESGFLSESIFYTVFERITGMTPREYRIQKAASDISRYVSLIP